MSDTRERKLLKKLVRMYPQETICIDHVEWFHRHNKSFRKLYRISAQQLGKDIIWAGEHTNLNSAEEDFHEKMKLRDPESV